MQGYGGFGEVRDFAAVDVDFCGEGGEEVWAVGDAGAVVLPDYSVSRTHVVSSFVSSGGGLGGY